MHRLPAPPNNPLETRSADERAYRNEQQRKQWHERIQLILIGWPTLIYFSGIFDHVLLPILYGIAPTPLFQIPSMIALISSIPVCFALYHFYQPKIMPFTDAHPLQMRRALPRRACSGWPSLIS